MGYEVLDREHLHGPVILYRAPEWLQEFLLSDCMLEWNVFTCECSRRRLYNRTKQGNLPYMATR